MKKLLLITLLVSSNILWGYSQNQSLEIGHIAPEIRLPDPKGNLVALSSFKGRLVLIDFWATWCAPCVKEQTELKGCYSRYKNAAFTHEKGFEIYGVSLDSKKEQWENGIREMKINWTQVSDLKFWSSPVAKLFKINSLPFNILIDGKGIIVAKNLHGNELINELEKRLLK